MTTRYAVVAIVDSERLADHHDQTAELSVNNAYFWEAKADEVRERGDFEDEMSTWEDRGDAEEELDRLREEDRRPWVSYELREVAR